MPDFQSGPFHFSEGQVLQQLLQYEQQLQFEMLPRILKIAPALFQRVDLAAPVWSQELCKGAKHKKSIDDLKVAVCAVGHADITRLGE